MEKTFTREDLTQLFKLLYRLEDHLEHHGKNASAAMITETIRKFNTFGIKECN